MKNFVFAALVVASWFTLPAAKTQTDSAAARPAEMLRRYLRSRAALSATPSLRFADELQTVYAMGSVEKPAGCPLTRILDQPPVASRDAVNLFVVTFATRPDTICQESPVPDACRAIANNCIRIESSVFCDQQYLNTRKFFAQLAYYSAWRGLRNVSSGQAAIFPPLSHDALVDLTSMSAAPNLTSAVLRMKEVPKATLFASSADSSVYQLASRVSLIVPLLHEVAHIEQKYCGRGVEGRGDVLELLTAGSRDYKLDARLYESLTCASLSRNELDADFQSIYLLLRYFQYAAVAAAAKPWFNFTQDVAESTRREVREMPRFTREVAILALLYGMEYELLVQNQPERGSRLVRDEPNADTIQPFVEYYLKAGDDPTLPRVRGHLEPAFRVAETSRRLQVSRFHLVNRGNALSLVDLRISPFSIGRFLAMRRQDCGAVEVSVSLQAVKDYVTKSFGRSTPQQTTASGYAGGIEAARKLLADFIPPGANREAMSARLQPTLQDYRAIFEPDFAEKAYHYYAPFWREKDVVITMEPEQTELLVLAASSDELRQMGSAASLQGGYRRVADKFRPGVVIYSWKYVQPGSQFGMAYDGLYYVNGRWVFIPKPYHVR